MGQTTAVNDVTTNPSRHQWLEHLWVHVQSNFNGSNADGSFTTAVSNSFLSPLENNPIAADFG